MILAITGHRPPKLGGYRTPNPVYSAVVARMRYMFETLRPSVVLTGMALGVDQWAADLCITMRIPFDAIIPFNGFSSRWPERSRQHYERLLRSARDTVVVSPTDTYSANLLYRRNAWMVDHCDNVLAVWNGSSGGTANCVEYANRVGKPVLRLELEDRIWREALGVEVSLSERRMMRNQANELTVNLGFNPDPNALVNILDRNEETDPRVAPARRRRRRMQPNQEVQPPPPPPVVPVQLPPVADNMISDMSDAIRYALAPFEGTPVRQVGEPISFASQALEEAARRRRDEAYAHEQRRVAQQGLYPTRDQPYNYAPPPRPRTQEEIDATMRRFQEQQVAAYARRSAVMQAAPYIPVQMIVTEPTPPPVKEIIAPEDRFKPMRKLDWDD